MDLKVIIVCGTKREHLTFDYLKYIYIPLTPIEIDLLGLDKMTSPCFRIQVER